MTSWNQIDPRIRQAADNVLTAKELDAIKLSLDGAGRRRIGHALGISDSAARDRLANAKRKLNTELGPILEDLLN